MMTMATMMMTTKTTMPIRPLLYILMTSHHRRMTRQKIKECADQDARIEEMIDKHANYTLLMAAHCKECGGKCCAIIGNGLCFFLDDGLSNAMPILEKDR
jgi:hypothetical protein